MKKRLLKSLILSLFFLSSVIVENYASIYLNSGGMVHLNNKSTEVVGVGGSRTGLQNEDFIFPGFSGGLEFPFKPNSFGFISSISIGFGNNAIALNRYNLANYEYSIKQLNGEESRVILTDGFPNGGLRDFSLQEQVQKQLNLNDRDYVVEATDLVIIANLLFKYSFPVDAGKSNPFFEYLTIGLKYINPYLAAGISNVIFNRKISFNSEILGAIESAHGAKLLKPCANDADGNQVCEEIIGKDLAPDPDFYFTTGIGFNVVVPQLRPLGNQLVFTLEALYHHNLSPDDSNKAFDDSYLFSQQGFSFRLAVGLVL